MSPLAVAAGISEEEAVLLTGSGDAGVEAAEEEEDGDKGEGEGEAARTVQGAEVVVRGR